MKVFISLLLLSFNFFSFGQAMSFQQVLDSGKNEYRRQFTEPISNYTKSYNLFEQAIKMQPNNTEARYFFAHAIEKKGLQDAETLHQTNKNQTSLASEQLELVNQIEKRYSGEIFLLDPYSKLTAIWGSLAMAYLYKGKKDSAVYAFREGKSRGAFNDAILEFNRLLMESCSKQSILLSAGDNITFSILYLQLIEGFRKDIDMVDINLISTKWYTDVLKCTTSVKLTYNDPLMDSMGYREWTPKEQIIINEANKDESIRWTLFPTYYSSYILKSDIVLLDIFKNNFFKRDFYYSEPYVDSSHSLHLDKAHYLVVEGIVSKVLEKPNVLDTPVLNVPKNFYRYSLDKIKKEHIVQSVDVANQFNQMRYAFLVYTYALIDKGKIEDAKSLFSEMEKRVPIDRLPLHESIKPAYEKLENDLKENRP